MSKKLYKIRVKTLEGRILKFTNVKSYKAEEGLIHFTDSMTGKPKTFSASVCEIEEVPVEEDKTRGDGK